MVISAKMQIPPKCRPSANDLQKVKLTITFAVVQEYIQK